MASESLKPGELSAGNARLAFDEQIAAIKGKLLLPTESYRDVDAAGHERGFVVAGAQKADLLADFYRAATAAIEKGETLEDFQSRFDDTVAHFGWDYNGTRAWRSRVIYQTNLTASYAQGRFTQLQSAAGDGLLWMYKHSDLSVTPRASHAALSGLVVSPTSPWWRTHYPPWVGGKMNYGCRCYVVAIHPAEVTRRGGRFASAAELQNMGAGAGYLPGDGSTQDLRALVEQKIAKLPRELGEAFRKDMEVRLAPVVEAPAPKPKAVVQVAPKAEVPMASDNGVMPAKKPMPTSQEIVEFAEKAFGASHIQELLLLGAVENPTAILDATGFDVSGYERNLDNFGVRHAYKRHGNVKSEEKQGQRAVTASDFSLIPEIVSSPDDIRYVGQSRHSKADLILFEKKIGDEVYFYVEEIRRKRRVVALETLWIRN